jgi:hypothetical protein
MRDCVMPVWRKASNSDGHGACVEVAVFPDGTIGIRDSKNPVGSKLVLVPPAWMAFLTATKAGHFDL